MKFLSPVTDIKCRFAVTSMASAQINIPDKAEFMRVYREDLAKKRAALAAAKKK